MDSSLAEFDVNVCWPGDLDAGPGSEDTGFVVDWGSLYDFLTRLEAGLCAFLEKHKDRVI